MGVHDGRRPQLLDSKERARHGLIARYANEPRTAPAYFESPEQTLQQRIADGQIVKCHVSDDENPADFLTKWVAHDKPEASAG